MHLQPPCHINDRGPGRLSFHNKTKSMKYSTIGKTAAKHVILLFAILAFVPPARSGDYTISTGNLPGAAEIKAAGNDLIILKADITAFTANYNIVGGSSGSVLGGLDAGVTTIRSDVAGVFRTLNFNKKYMQLGRNQILELYDIIITNGAFTDSGAILFRGTAGGNTGNANAVDGGIGIVRGNFIIQSSSASVSGNQRGGAIYAKNGGLVVDGTATFRNNYAGSWGGAIGAYGSEIDFTGPVTFLNNRSGAAGGAVMLSSNALGAQENNPYQGRLRYGMVQFDSTAYFEGNISTGNGGGISSAGNVIIDGQAVFISNTAGGTGNGGALYSSGSNWVDTGTNWFDVDLGANTPAWPNGKPNRPARVFDNFEVAASSTFAGNYAGGSGGAIYVGGSSAKIGAGTIFLDNSAQNNGGAVFIGNGTMSLHNITFSGNTAARGGAVYINNADVTVDHTNVYTGNSATDSGGLFYVNNGTLVFNAQGGNIVLEGSYADATPNAVGVGAMGGLVVDTGEGNTVTFLDGITGGGTGATLVHRGNGSLVLDAAAGVQIFSATLATTVESGTLKLLNGAKIGTTDGYSINNITIGEGAALVGNGGVYAGQGVITVGNNATLEVQDGGKLDLWADMYMGALRNFGTGLNLAGSGTIITPYAAGDDMLLSSKSVLVGAPGTAHILPQTLTIGSGAIVNIEDGGMITLGIFGNGVSSQLFVDKLTVTGSAFVNLFGTDPGSYKIITANNDMSGYDFTVYMNGSAPQGRYAPAVVFHEAGKEAWIEFLIKNFSMTWVGGTSAVWRNSMDPADSNWTDGAPVPELVFMNGDRANFTDSSMVKTITIDNAGVVVAGMIVNNTVGNDYTFEGAGGVTASTTNSLGLLASGKLIKNGTGVLVFENTGPNFFEKGIEIYDGVVAFNSAAQINDGGNGIRGINSGTLRSNAGSITIGNTLVASTSTNSLAVDVAAGNQLTHTGLLSGSGTIAKIGQGVVVLKTDSAASFSGDLLAKRGFLYVDGGRVGSAIIAAGATFGGSGSAANVTVLSGGILRAGMPGTTGVLNVGLLDMSAGGGVISFNILGNNQSSSINVGAFADSTPYIIDIDDWAAGSYSLGNLPSFTTLTYRGQVLNSRQTYTPVVLPGSFTLTLDPTVNRTLYWTGTDAGVDGQWDNSSQNWRDIATTLPSPFVKYDAVIFDDRVAATAHRSVVLSDTMTVSSMNITGAGDYVFTGDGAIVTNASGVAGLTGSSTNAILSKVGAGKLTFQNAGSNYFLGGISLGAAGASGGSLEFTAVRQIAVGNAAAISFSGDATLRALAGASGTVAAKIIIANGISATLDVGANTIALTGPTVLTGATGTLNKLGTGVLSYAGSSAAAAGLTTNLTAGNLILNAGTLGGTINMSPNTLLGGYGTASGTVRTANSTIVLVGFDEIGGSNTNGTLNIGNLQLMAGSTIIGSGTLSGGATIMGAATLRVAAGDNITLSGVNTGAGSLVKKGTGNLIYTSAAALGYTGGTQIDEGLVMLRGIEGGVSHTITLNGGWLDLSDAGTFDPAGSPARDWETLTIIQGANSGMGGIIGTSDCVTLGAGAIASNLGTVTRKGLFVVIDANNGVATLTGSNGYAGYTRIDSGTLVVSANDQLGDAALNREVVLNGGALQITGSLTTARKLELRSTGIIETMAESTWAGITGTGGLTKTGTGTLTIVGSSSARSLNVNAGRYTTSHAGGFGVGVVSVASGAVAEYCDNIAAGTIPSSFSGAGSLNIVNAGEALMLTGSSSIARIKIENTFVTAIHGNSVGNAATELSLDRAQIWLAGASSELGKVTFGAQSSVGFIQAGGPKSATIASIAGAGRLVFNADFAEGWIDHITIGAAPQNDIMIAVNNIGGNPGTETSGVAYELILVPAGQAKYILEGGVLEVGMHVFEIHEQEVGGMSSISLIGTDFSSRPGVHIRAAASAVPLMWFSELDNIQKRFGELRYRQGAKNGAAAWVRARGERYESDAKVTGAPFNEDQYGVDAGFDYAFRGAEADLYLGGFLGYGQASREVDSRWGGEGNSDSMHGGIYGTIVTSKGWRIGASLKMNAFKNDFTVDMTSRETVTADYKSNAVGGAFEVSKEINIGKGWFAEPRMQGAMVVLGAADYNTNNDMEIRLSRGSVTQGLLGARLGHTYAKGDTLFQPYINLYAAAQTASGARIYVDGEDFKSWIKGKRYGGGAGINWMPSRSIAAFLDYEYSTSDYYKKPWGITFGFRYNW